jgi:hypothetical protein
LKRYGKFVGKRPEYRQEKAKNSQQQAVVPPGLAVETLTGPPLLPIPVRQPAETSERGHVVQPQFANALLAENVGEDQSSSASVAEEVEADDEPGQFIANDMLDEGVKLLSKLRHGASLEEAQNGPGTRTRRAAVKVICVARCPTGGQFATGSDDGICRVWRDEDDNDVRNVDLQVSSYYERMQLLDDASKTRNRREYGCGWCL